MKVIGHAQFKQKKYKMLGFAGKWREHMGDAPEAWMGIIYGDAGNGKTDYSIQLAKYLTGFDAVAWLSYEQGHGPDLQMAIERNDLDNVKHPILFADPTAKRHSSHTLVEELDSYLSKRSTPHFVFIDSLDYLRMTTEEYFALKEKHGKKKGITFISHATGPTPKSRTGRDIEYDGQFGTYVKRFIAYPKKNRLGGTEDYIIWDKGARERNALYFKRKEAEKL